MFISETLDEDDDLYDFVDDEEDKGDEIYEDLMKTEEHPQRVSGVHLTFNQILPLVVTSLHLMNMQQKSFCSSQNAAWTNGSAACRRSDRQRKNTRRHWNL